MTGSTADPGAGLLRLHAIVPHLTTGDLLRGVSRVLRAGGTPLGVWRAGRHGQVLRHDGVTAEVAGSWDGPELRLRCGNGPAHASRAGELLADIAVAAGDAKQDPRPRARIPTAGSWSGNGYRAWQAMMRHWCVPESAVAEIRAPGQLSPVDWLFADSPTLDSPMHEERPHTESLTFVFDHIGPPEPPRGWLLRSWFSPDAGTFHLSVRSRPPGRLQVRTPLSADREQAAALLSAWRTVTAELDDRPDLPPAALSIPPRAFVLPHHPSAAHCWNN
ncbi:hypothetical protein QMK19_36025 [Streptomyces sp. H10-C2]|uniref:hypothetical protein n=1 Tax=unclassified Streptomyces TaxID=2593676 RepID=UPI0024BA788A|nr:MULTISPECIES: hypothetical protein [unclassified Streptomyces]MDJ0344127.1 hypothetical protein [Streptomyces sp. PH10-H1]MDJ0374883.1 hypothetical protein [Streptomyces sp. H10-C2]